MQRRISGWGRFPVAWADVADFSTQKDLARLLAESGPRLARGLARSYGDAALAPAVAETTRFGRILAFDPDTGVVRCQAGTPLSALVNAFLPRGWFLPVVPGTRHVTVGGAVAADVHGKNHHVAGCFGAWVRGLVLMDADGALVRFSPVENPDLFHATCGGMGLTGIIVFVDLALVRVPSSGMVRRTIRARNLDQALDLFHENAHVPYSVAWIDCLARGRHQGRSVYLCGDHAPDGPLRRPSNRALPVPGNCPSFVMNRRFVRLFNTLYFRLSRPSEAVTDLGSFFWPLDGLARWHRLYGRQGFVQYQFVVPAEAGRRALPRILDRVSEAGTGSFLAVLKLLGPENGNLLSFPLAGYTLALDFPATPRVFQLLRELDAVVADAGGRLYLAKDARMTPAMFCRGYPGLAEFRRVRHAFGADRFASFLSRRLEI